MPKLAAAFQPRAAARTAIDRARRNEDGTAALSQVLSGDGGVGKSQLAAALARELRDQERGQDSGLDVLVWVSAGEADQIITAYAAAAVQLGLLSSGTGDLTTEAEAFLAWLAVTERRWLVVLDDITNPGLVDAWWPDGSARNGRVLATTRRSDAILSGQGRRLVHLDLYTAEEAVDYLRRRLSDAGQPQLFKERDAGHLARSLGLLPLALGHAAAYMINNRCDAGTYLSRFHAAGNTLADLLPPEADAEGYGRPVTKALLLSLDAVQSEDHTQLAVPLLQLISLTDPLGHPADLWTTPPALAHLRTRRPAGRPRLRRRGVLVTGEHVRSALDLLRTYALVAQDTNQAPLRIHALTARAVRETITDQELHAMAHIIADSLNSLWPNLDHTDRDLCATLRTNVVILDQNTHPHLWQPKIHPIAFRVADSFRLIGLVRQAVEHNQHALQKCLAFFGADHSNTLRALNGLARSFRAAGRNQESLDVAEKALTESERLLGPDHPNTLNARSSLAYSCRAAGRHQDALDVAEKVVVDSERILGLDHPNTSGARYNLAISYSNAGRTQDALDLAEKVLADSERALGPNHPNTLTVRDFVASCYRDAGRSTQEALDLAEQVLADSERIFGPDHPDTVRVRGNLANAYRDAGHYQKSLDLRKRVLADRLRIFGSDHPDTLGSRHNIAVSYADVGQNQKALEVRQEVASDSERILGPEHPDTISARHNLSVSYSTIGRTPEAVDLAEKVLADSERILGPGHPNTIHVRAHLSMCYLAVGRTPEAVDLAEKALADSERTLGPEHPDTLKARALAYSYSIRRNHDFLDSINKDRPIDQPPNTIGAGSKPSHLYWKAAESLQSLDAETSAGASEPQPLSGTTGQTMRPSTIELVKAKDEAPPLRSQDSGKQQP